MSNTKISDKGIWLEDSAEHMADLGLLHGLKVLMSSGSLVDFGCGRGTYARALADCNFQVQAYDGNPNTAEMTNGFADVLDLSESFDLKKRFDFVLSFEVGEHIPPKYEQIFLDNLCRHANKAVVISWATPNQGGHGHVNERTNKYIIREFQQRGFSYGHMQSSYLRSKAFSLRHFEKTILVFHKVGTKELKPSGSERIAARIGHMLRNLNK